jgi:two-component system sensor histidine kinase YesM
MRSILKHEDETAEMIEQLSLMERQYVDWGTDIVSLGAEIGFVESYLKLQKYRFGDRLRYSIEMEDDCREYQIPKLSLVTFTENSCVHGIEGKASQSWIFVRVYKDKNNLHLEVEDTGEGMPEEYLNYLQERMEEANIEMLKEKGRVGVINACVRLKMYTGHHVKFHIESERGVGTEVSVVIPLNAIS